MNLHDVLTECVMLGASDLFLSSGVSPMLRLHGDLTPLRDRAWQHDDIHPVLMDVMTAAQQSQFQDNHECDFSLEIADGSRFRVNVFEQARGVAAVFRVIPHGIPSLQILRAPDIFSDLVSRTQGLVLVTGPTGSGKSTTLAALLNKINQTQTKHIITIEDPIEFVHTPKQSLIQQREVGCTP